MKPIFPLLLLALLGWAACQSSSTTEEKDQNKQEANKPHSAIPRQGQVAEKAEAYQALTQKLRGTLDIPEGMVLVPGGASTIGSDQVMPTEKPVHKRAFPPFLMDKHPVTVAEFRQFVEATGYQTQAEKFGNSGVITVESKRWQMVDSANWQYPRGPEAGPAPDDHPVTQVSLKDAQAYCQWAGKRLPTEFEWEYAARNAGRSKSIYPFGNHIRENGQYNANIWNGKFPHYNRKSDGYYYTNPVGEFGETPLGLTDMCGNVWEWTTSDYVYYDDTTRQASASGDPETTIRGGSFLCEDSWCHGYRVSGRSGTTPETGLVHVGFRCVKDIPEAQ